MTCSRRRGWWVPSRRLRVPPGPPASLSLPGLLAPSRASPTEDAQRSAAVTPSPRPRGSRQPQGRADHANQPGPDPQRPACHLLSPMETSGNCSKIFTALGRYEPLGTAPGMKYVLKKRQLLFNLVSLMWVKQYRSCFEKEMDNMAT